MRQVIIARKDLHMSAGKLAAQCCHASIAFLTTQLRDPDNCKPVNVAGYDLGYDIEVYIPKDIYTDWICGRFIKTICEAKNKNQLMKAIEIAKELELEEGEDYFLIKDACFTELQPEEFDEDGNGRVLTCIGFRPLPDDLAHKISKKFHLYVG